MAQNITWSWQQFDWPNFSYDPSRLKEREEQFLRASGTLLGAYKHVSEEERQTLTIDLMIDEALKTSEVEGEILNRDSVQSSIRRKLGLSTDRRNVKPAMVALSFEPYFGVNVGLRCMVLQFVAGRCVVLARCFVALHSVTNCYTPLHPVSMFQNQQVRE